MTQDEADDSFGLPLATIKFPCHSAADITKKGFMRIYIQIPITGAVACSPRVWAPQVVTQRKHIELEALKSLTGQKCKVVSELLGCYEGQQSDEGCVPGSYIDYIVWDSIDSKDFWERDLKYRDEVRQFRAVYEYVYYIPSNYI